MHYAIFYLAINLVYCSTFLLLHQKVCMKIIIISSSYACSGTNIHEKNPITFPSAACLLSYAYNDSAIFQTTKLSHFFHVSL